MFKKLYSLFFSRFRKAMRKWLVSMVVDLFIGGFGDLGIWGFGGKDRQVLFAGR
jgi:hypothetical protein